MEPKTGLLVITNLLVVLVLYKTWILQYLEQAPFFKFGFDFRPPPHSHGEELYLQVFSENLGKTPAEDIYLFLIHIDKEKNCKNLKMLRSANPVPPTGKFCPEFDGIKSDAFSDSDVLYLEALYIDHITRKPISQDFIQKVRVDGGSNNKPTFTEASIDEKYGIQSPRKGFGRARVKIGFFERYSAKLHGLKRKLNWIPTLRG